MEDGIIDTVMQKVLVVEDEPDVAELVAFNLNLSISSFIEESFSINVSFTGK